MLQIRLYDTFRLNYHLVNYQVVCIPTPETPDEPLEPAIKTVPTLQTTLKRPMSQVAGLSSSIVIVPDIV
jgi:hypothetical protein